ncbi:MAG: hypothetical protein ABDH32_04995 [Candidatus Caldarchaeales archaeon]
MGSEVDHGLDGVVIELERLGVDYTSELKYFLEELESKRYI